MTRGVRCCRSAIVSAGLAALNRAVVKKAECLPNEHPWTWMSLLQALRPVTLLEILVAGPGGAVILLLVDMICTNVGDLGKGSRLIMAQIRFIGHTDGLFYTETMAKI